MSYFKHFPNILYQSPLSHKDSSGDFIAVKNIFRRTKLKDYLQGSVSVFNKYIIEDGERPRHIALRLGREYEALRKKEVSNFKMITKMLEGKAREPTFDEIWR